MIVNPNPLRPRVTEPARAPSTTTGGWVLGAATVATGLMAGLFWTYANSVLPGLGQSDDRTFVAAMQRMNVAIQNPVFVPVFFGAFVLPAVAAVVQRRLGARDALRWTVAAAVLYGLALAITFGVNIPLNDQLDRAGAPDRIADLSAVRDDFEGPWVATNILRAVLSTAALGCLGRALVLFGRRSGHG
jgi:uncharacterized membrane protein